MTRARSLRGLVLLACAYVATLAPGLSRAPIVGASEPIEPWPSVPSPYGMGGGGALFEPRISPHDEPTMFVQCDMKGVYRTTNGGASWTMIDGNQLSSLVCDDCPETAFGFDPVDPNRIYAFGTHEGRDGLFVSSDLGATFRSFLEAAPWGAATVSALVIDAQRMLAATTDGMFVSSDGGATFHRSIVPGDPHARVLGATFGRANASEVPSAWIATADSVARSTDGGESFEDATRGLPGSQIRHLAAFSSSLGARTTLYVTVESRLSGDTLDGGIYRRDESDDAFVRVMGEGINVRPDRVDPFGLDDLPQYGFIAAGAGDTRESVYATTRGNGLWPPFDFNLWKSDDRGRSYREVLFGDLGLPEKMGITPNVTAGWLTHEYDWSWGGDAYGLGASPRDPRHVLVSNLGELFETRDGGDSWAQIYTQSLPEGLPPARGMRWRSRGLDVTTSYHAYADPFDPQVRFVTHADIGLSRSTDGGHTWRHAVAGSPWTNSFYELAFDPVIHGRLWAAVARQHDIPHWTQLEGQAEGRGGGVVMSDDDGTTWSARVRGLPDAPVTSILIDPESPPDARRLWVSVFGDGLYRSDDGAATWTRIALDLGSPSNRNFTVLRRHPRGALDLLITGKRTGKSMVGESALYRSFDGGSQWARLTAKGQVPDRWLSGFDVDAKDAQTIYLAASDAPGSSDGDIYRTKDGGATWARLGLPRRGSEPLEVFAPSIDPHDRHTVFATTNGNGTWVSRDEGARWTEIALPFRSTHYVDRDPLDPHVIHITTFGGGTWRVPFD